MRYRKGSRKLKIHIEQLKEPSIIQKLMEEDADFKKGVKDIAQRISDKFPQKA
jgi:hypothetical protein